MPGRHKAIARHPPADWSAKARQTGRAGSGHPSRVRAQASRGRLDPIRPVLGVLDRMRSVLGVLDPSRRVFGVLDRMRPVLGALEPRCAAR